VVSLAAAGDRSYRWVLGAEVGASHAAWGREYWRPIERLDLSKSAVAGL